MTLSNEEEAAKIAMGRAEPNDVELEAAEGNADEGRPAPIPCKDASRRGKVVGGCGRGVA